MTGDREQGSGRRRKGRSGLTRREGKEGPEVTREEDYQTDKEEDETEDERREFVFAFAFAVSFSSLFLSSWSFSTALPFFFFSSFFIVFYLYHHHGVGR
jgi:hypothetical protein